MITNPNTNSLCQWYLNKDITFFIGEALKKCGEATLFLSARISYIVCHKIANFWEVYSKRFAYFLRMVYFMAYDILFFALLLTVTLSLVYGVTLKENNKRLFKEVRDVTLTEDELLKSATLSAANHKTDRLSKNADYLLVRLRDNYRVILNSRRLFEEAANKNEEFIPAAEWLIDNFYLIHEEVDDLEKSFTNGFADYLPVISAGTYVNFPRVYMIAMEILSHTDGEVDDNLIISYLNKYQTVNVLTMAEIWALLLMLKFVLVEYIRQLCEKMQNSYEQWNLASEAALFIKNNTNTSEPQIRKIFEAKYENSLDHSFIERFVFYVRKLNVKSQTITKYLNSSLSKKGLNIEGLIELEHKFQSELLVNMGNCVTSLRYLTTTDWGNVYDATCQVETILKEDPQNVYSQMDVTTKKVYSEAVRRLAKEYSTTEIHIARTVVSCAKSNNESPKNHVGYYLVDKGVSEMLEAASISGIKHSMRSGFKGGYPAFIIVLTLFFSAIICNVIFGLRSEIPLWLKIIAFVLTLLPASELSVHLINILIGKVVKPRLIPKMDLKKGIPENTNVFVIIPTLLSSEKRAKELINQLEKAYLGNTDDNIYFALVGDLKDANEAHLDTDKIIIDAAIKGIHNLNDKYNTENKISDRFYFVYRDRKLLEKENKWVGWERKRGAIVEFNLLLNHEMRQGVNIVGSFDKLPLIDYVITLDADTQMPIGAVKRLVGAMIHPLNTPRVDKEKGAVIDGYGIIQPRVGIDMESSNKSIYSMIYASDAGINPYSGAISNIYQDIYGEGIFTGKGIYDVKVFNELLSNSIPDNTILSHDLLEGSILRTGLDSSIVFIDGFPAKYNSASMRLHRWVRGDWQLLPWIIGSNNLNFISKWKMLDNLRRSLINPALLILIVLGYSILPGSGLKWLLFSLIIAAVPLWGYAINMLVSGNIHFIKEKSFYGSWSPFEVAVSQSLINITFLPHQAILMLDAIIKTLTRVLFTKKNMLEWTTAADMELLLKNSVRSFYRFMWEGPVFGLIVLLFSFFIQHREVYSSVILLFIWTLAPLVAFYISQGIEEKSEGLNEEDFELLRRICRKTWAFYEDFAGSEDNYLPPDNYQELPTKVIAHRTSPTNIGFLLLSTLAAKDLGFIRVGEMLDLLDKTISTIEKMEKWNGHLFNWYETKNLRLLCPRYVSTVDSGNFLGDLITIASSLQNQDDLKEDVFVLLNGLYDTADMINHENSKDKLLNLQELKHLIHKKDDKNIKKVIEELRSELVKLEGSEDAYWKSKILKSVDRVSSLLDGDSIGKDDIRIKSENLLNRINYIIREADFKYLYNPERQLFSIGYNYEENRLTGSYYDLLASEARLTSYIAIAKGDVPVIHWERLGRKLVKIEGYRGLVSWTGTMFEYLMPLLLIKSFRGTILDETYEFVVQNQIKHGKLRQIPWGVSESGFNDFDISLNYQYKAFGIAELALKRGLENDVVIAPYASAMAVMVSPKDAVENIRKLIKRGFYGRYGLFEAVDFTPSRIYDEKEYSIVQSYMAHHQGMSMIAIVNMLCNNIMQRRFHADMKIAAAELLIQERMPSRTVFAREHRVLNLSKRNHKFEYEDAVRSIEGIDLSLPKMSLLSNGIYSTMLTDSGLGYGKVNDIALYRWNKDIREKKTGFFLFIQNLNSNDVWSSTYEPLGINADSYSVTFAPDKAEYKRTDGSIESVTEITVSPEDNVEVRRLTLTNRGDKMRELEVTSYMEVIMTSPDSDIAHPAFSNLFIRTEYNEEKSMLLASRRPRMEGQPTLWSFHRVSVEGEVIGDVSYETDRSKFIGRNRSIENPVALDVSHPLTNSIGAVIDPVFSLRVKVRVMPKSSVRICFSVGMTECKENILKISEKYKDCRGITRAFELSYTRSIIEASFLELSPGEYIKYLEVVPHLLLFSNIRKKQKEYIINNQKGQSGLWAYGISGDIPIIAVAINSIDATENLAWLLKAHEFYRHRGVFVDIVVLIEDKDSGYIQPVYQEVKRLIDEGSARDLLGKRGGVFILNKNVLPQEDITLILNVAAFVIHGDEESGSVLKQLQLDTTQTLHKMPTNKKCPEGRSKPKKIVKLENSEDLLFFNGIGGFTKDGLEYVITLPKDQSTPLPWVNIISNNSFGFQVSESGAGSTWAENGRENKLTPWSNDPVTDPLGEVIYIRELTDNRFWSVTPKPCGDASICNIRHGLGYTVFSQETNGLEQQLTVFVSTRDKIKLSYLKIKNNEDKIRELDITYYVRPVMGVNDRDTNRYIVTELSQDIPCIIAKNTYNMDFKDRLLFITTSQNEFEFTCDREEFIGLDGSLANPKAMCKKNLSGKVGAGYDPCIAISFKVEIKPREETSIVLGLGQAMSKEEVMRLREDYVSVDKAILELNNVKEMWHGLTTHISVTTPDKSMDIMLNSWLLYQVISCRLWARAAFYQSGGAFGFRDQLQDVMAVCHVEPEVTRRQILLHASRQFIEGDVQHWWHEPDGKGIRTRYSDDLLWLPYVTCDYIDITGDYKILDEEIGFLESPVLRQGEDERYEVPTLAKEKATLFEHCIRTIELGLRVGENGIPLMGSGDWNDGMNTVGNKGKGESVWLGWFVYAVVQRFKALCEYKGENELAQRYNEASINIVNSIEDNAWDGNWYRRAYFDDGTPLGSKQNSECTIDSISQSWAAITGAGKKERVLEALHSVEQHLVNNDDGIIKLLTPAFDKSDLHPGYIKSYLPGVRENGGQYTHAATWTIMAFAKMCMGDRAWELFNMVNPINHANTWLECQKYKVEPYVISADVYAVPPHNGRGGWSWYTGAAGWFYRVGIEHILGLKMKKGKLYIDPCIPTDWKTYQMKINIGKAQYKVVVKNDSSINRGIKKLVLNGKEVEQGITLIDDGQKHVIEAYMGD